MIVAQIFRSTNETSRSIEILFDVINSNLSEYQSLRRIKLVTRRADPFSIILNALYLYIFYFKLIKRRDVIFHITGECYYIAIFLFWKNLIITYHDDYALKNTSNPISYWYIKYFYYSLPIKLAKEVVFISRATMITVSQYTSIPTNSVVIHNPRTLNYGLEKAPSLMGEFKNESPFFLVIGTNPNKNIDRILEILPKNSRVVIVGKLQKIHFDRCLDRHVTLINYKFVSVEELRYLYRNAFCLLFLSTYEGFGLPIIEAQYFGCPVICSSLEVFKEIANPNSVIFIDDSVKNLNDKINFLNTPEFRSSLISNAKINSFNFNPEIASQKYQTLYDKFNFEL